MTPTPASPKTFFLSILCSPHGGIATYVLGLLQAQSSQESLIGLACNFSHADSFFVEKIGHIAGLSSDKVLKLQTHKLPCLGSLYDLLALVRYCRSQPCNNNIVLVAHGTSSAGLAFVVALFIRRCRFFYIPHGGISHLYNSRSLFLRLGVFLFDSLMSFSGARFLCESRYTYNLYRSIASKSPCFSPSLRGYIYSLTQDLFSQICSPCAQVGSNSFSVADMNPFTVVYLGTWRFIKGSMHLLDILDQMGSEHASLPNGRPIRFLFYTDHRPFPNFCPSGDGPEVSFQPWSSDVPSILNNADAQIIPSRGESFGYAAIEALVAGLPIVHTNVGGLCEIMAETKMPIIPVDFNASDLYEAIIEISSSSFDQLLAGCDPLGRIVDGSFWGANSYVLDWP